MKLLIARAVSCILVAVAFGGCVKVDYPTGLDCSPEHTCPPNQFCFGGKCQDMSPAPRDDGGTPLGTDGGGPGRDGGTSTFKGFAIMDLVGGPGTKALAVGDMNGDGYLDVVAAFQTGQVQVFHAFPGPTPMFSTLGSLPFGTDIRSIAVGDLTGDGMPDIVGADFQGTPSLVVLAAVTGGGQFTPKTGVFPGAIPSAATAVAVAQFDGMGGLDVLATFDSGAQFLYHANGGALVLQDLGAGIPDPATIVVGDLSAGPLKADVLIGSLTTGGIELFENPSGMLEQAGPVLGGSAKVAGIAIGELGGGTLRDFVVADPGNGKCPIYVQQGLGMFTLTNALVGGSPVAVAVGDFDGNGLDDVAAADATNKDVEIFLQTSPGMFAQAVHVPTDGMPALLIAADLNKDGKADLVVGNGAGMAVVVLIAK